MSRINKRQTVETILLDILRRLKILENTQRGVGGAGEPGEDGQDGSKWYANAGAPGSGLGIVGDFYLNTTNGDVYEKTGTTTWTLVDNLTGPPGEDGIIGEDGEPGEDGADGADGADGDDGISPGFTFSWSGTLTTFVGAHRQYIPVNCTITNVIASVGTQPTGAAIRIDVNKNGTTIFTTQGNRPNIAVSTNSDTSSTPDVTSLTAGDYLTVDCDVIGSTIAGADLVVQVIVSS